MARLARLAALALTILALALAAAKLALGGGEPFPIDTTAPERQAEIAATLPLPPGCVTVSPDGRVFFDTHPFAAPGRQGAPHVFELVEGEARPWPSLEAQSRFVAPFGITADTRGRLWVTEPATLDRSTTRILGFDRQSGALLHEIVLPDGEARFAQDLRVSPDGEKLVLADTGILTLTPAQLLVMDIASGKIERVLRHPAFNPQDWFIRRWDGTPHRIAWGLVMLKVGLDGLTFSTDGAWLYLAPMSHDTLYRLSARALLDPSASDEAVLASLEAVASKPQSDGIAATADGAVLVTDVERGGLVEIRPDGSRRVLTAAPEVVWADSVEVGPDGVVWYTDSAIPAYLRQDMRPPSAEVLAAAGPYHLYRLAR